MRRNWSTAWTTPTTKKEASCVLCEGTSWVTFDDDDRSDGQRRDFFRTYHHLPTYVAWLEEKSIQHTLIFCPICLLFLAKERNEVGYENGANFKHPTEWKTFSQSRAFLITPAGRRRKRDPQYTNLAMVLRKHTRQTRRKNKGQQHSASFFVDSRRRLWTSCQTSSLKARLG